MSHQVLSILENILGASSPSGKENYSFYCPKCRHHKKKLQFNIRYGHYHCWVCHFKGRSPVTLATRLGRRDVVPELKTQLGIIKIRQYDIFNPFADNSGHEFRLIKFPNNTFPIFQKDNIHYLRARNYLKKIRGMSDTDIKRYDIRFCEDDYRIIIPSYDDKGILNTYNARALDNQFPKYREPDGVDKGAIIGFEYFINWNLPVIIVEGMFDAITVRHNAIPLLGTSLRESVKRKIIENDSKVYICLDDEADKYALNIIEFLNNFNIETYFVDLPEEQDPSTLGYSKVWEHIKTAQLTGPEFIVRTKLKLNL